MLFWSALVSWGRLAGLRLFISGGMVALSCPPFTVLGFSLSRVDLSSSSASSSLSSESPLS